MMISINNGSQIIDHLDSFERHFQEYGTPISIGGGVLAWTMLGVAIDENKPENSKFLI